jgi:hypothetical protein
MPASPIIRWLGQYDHFSLREIATKRACPCAFRCRLGRVSLPRAARGGESPIMMAGLFHREIHEASSLRLDRLAHRASICSCKTPRDEATKCAASEIPPSTSIALTIKQSELYGVFYGASDHPGESFEQIVKRVPNRVNFPNTWNGRRFEGDLGHAYEVARPAAPRRTVSFGSASRKKVVTSNRLRTQPHPRSPLCPNNLCHLRGSPQDRGIERMIEVRLDRLRSRC